MYFTEHWKTVGFYLTAVFLLVLDRWLKVLALHNFSTSLLGNVLKFNFVKNYYIAFSLPISGVWLNLLIGLIILVLIYYFIWLFKKPSRLEAGFIFLVILGAISNLFDRVSFGFVVDYFDLSYFTIFNLADVMICLGVLGFIFGIKNHK
jgi:signal peptidase II